MIAIHTKLPLESCIATKIEFGMNPAAIKYEYHTLVFAVYQYSIDCSGSYSIPETSTRPVEIAWSVLRSAVYTSSRVVGIIL